MLGIQKNLSPPKIAIIRGVRVTHVASLPGLQHLSGGRKELKQGEGWIFESFPVSSERILWEAREFGRAAAAWTYFLIGKKKKGNMISKFNFIVMLMVEPSGNRYSES